VRALGDTWGWFAVVLGVINIFLVLIVVLGIVAIGVPTLMRPQRKTDTAGVYEELAARYASFEGLPRAAVEPMLRAAHDTCYAASSKRAWFSRTLDRAAYGQCVADAVGKRLAGLVRLHSPQFVEHTDPQWWRLNFSIDAEEGYLPPSPTLKTSRTCAGSAPTEGESGTSRDLFRKTDDRHYASETMVLKEAGPCHYRVSLAYATWELGPPLEVDGPAPGAVLPPAASMTPPPAAGGGSSTADHILEIFALTVRIPKADEPRDAPPGTAAFTAEAIVVDAAEDTARNPLNAFLTADCDGTGSMPVGSLAPVPNLRGMGTGKVLVSVPGAIPLEKTPHECDVTITVRHTTGIDAIRTAHLTLP